MKKLLFSATLLMGLIGSAHADQLPKKLIGKWCASEARGGTYVKTLKNEPCDEPFIITHKDLGPATEAPCNIISVTVEKNDGPVHFIARCSHTGKEPKSTIVFTFRLRRDSFLDISEKAL